MNNSPEETLLNRTTQPSAIPTIHEKPSFEPEKQDHHSTSSRNSASHEFDPCAIAKPCSPFYLYRHDSSRPSIEQAHLKPHGSAIHVSVQDLEAGNLTPIVTQEKRKQNGAYIFYKCWLVSDTEKFRRRCQPLHGILRHENGVRQITDLTRLRSSSGHSFMDTAPNP